MAEVTSILRESHELADWEEDHYMAFQNQLNSLKDEYFIANNFVPM